MEKQQVLSWDDEGIDVDENVTEADIKEAEAMGKFPVCKFLAECIGSDPIQKDFANYSCIAAKLKWQVRKVLELNDVAVQGSEGDAYEGRSIFDEVAMYSPEEKDGMRKRRILIAKRTGLIADSAETITKAMWGKSIIGKTVIIDYIEEEYKDKNDITKKSRKIAFNGYESADGMDIEDQTPDIDDI